MSNEIRDTAGRIIFTHSGAHDIHETLRLARAKKVSLEYADFSKMDLEGANFNAFRLTGAKFTGSVLDNACFEASSLRYASLNEVSAKHAFFAGCDMWGALLGGSCFERALLNEACLRYASLAHTDFSEATLSGADFRNTIVYRTNFTGAFLSEASFRNAHIDGVRGLSPQKVQPLYMLFDQPGKIRAYKLVGPNGYGPFYGGIHYKIGQTYEETWADRDNEKMCAAGINVATLDWCLWNWREGFRILIVEFEAADIAAIPIASEGKFRLRRCTVVEEKDVSDLVG